MSRIVKATPVLTRFRGIEGFSSTKVKRMSPLNRGSPLGSRQLPAGARPLPPPRFGGRPAIPQRIPPLPPRLPSPPRMRRIPPPINPMFGPGDPRQRIPPLPSPQPLRPVAGGGMSRLSGRDMPPLFPGGPRARHLAPIVPPMGPRGPLMRPWPRRMMPPQMMPPMRPMRYNAGNGSLKSKPSRNAKKLNNRTVRIFSYSYIPFIKFFKQLLLSLSYMTV